MAVETIGEAWRLGWRITARCAFGNNDGMRSIRSCYQYDLDLRTLIWTRGASYPLSNLATPTQMPELRIAARCAGLSHAERTADGEGPKNGLTYFQKLRTICIGSHRPFYLCCGHRITATLSTRCQRDVKGIGASL